MAIHLKQRAEDGPWHSRSRGAAGQVLGAMPIDNGCHPGQRQIALAVADQPKA